MITLCDQNNENGFRMNNKRIEAVNLVRKSTNINSKRQI